MAWFTRFITSVLVIPWEAYVLSVLWRWYLEPLGAPVLSVVHAIGVVLIVGLLVGMATKTTSIITSLHAEAHDESVVRTSQWMSSAGAVILPALFLLLGWIGTGLMQA